MWWRHVALKNLVSHSALHSTKNEFLAWKIGFQAMKGNLKKASNQEHLKYLIDVGEKFYFCVNIKLQF